MFSVVLRETRRMGTAYVDIPTASPQRSHSYILCKLPIAVSRQLSKLVSAPYIVSSTNPVLQEKAPGSLFGEGQNGISLAGSAHSVS